MADPQTPGQLRGCGITGYRTRGHCGIVGSRIHCWIVDLLPDHGYVVLSPMVVSIYSRAPHLVTELGQAIGCRIERLWLNARFVAESDAECRICDLSAAKAEPDLGSVAGSRIRTIICLSGVNTSVAPLEPKCEDDSWCQPAALARIREFHTRMGAVTRGGADPTSDMPEEEILCPVKRGLDLTLPFSQN